jgi:selenide,water dikinase
VENADVVAVLPNAVVLADGRQIPSDFTNGAAGARPHDWVADTGLDLTDGFLNVRPTLQTSDGDIFAVGDCAHLTHAPRPKAGVYAVRQAPVLYDNLRARLSGGPLRPYHPQKDYLKLISLGGKTALAEKLGTARRGKLLWRWKDHIDRTFMNQFDPLPVMPTPALPLKLATGVAEALGDAPLCGGCGAKVGKGALSAALAQLPATTRSDIQSLPGDDAAILRTGGATQVLTTDHLSAVTADPVVMTRIACIHALGDVWAMGAAPQAATLSLILPRMTDPLQRRTLDEVIVTASEVLTDAGAAIVGGHTTQGDSLTIGLSLTGLCETPPITLAGAKPGDVLILTKPIGSGTILAGEMRGQARGVDVLACWGWMVRPQAQAAQQLAGAHAMTDVTGFGLAGHLDGMCEASGVGATVRLNDVPLLEGAHDLAAAGVRSSLHPANRTASLVPVPDTPLGALMFDPQTCGGLLAAVPKQLADQIAESQSGWIIGEITDGKGVSFI